MDLFSTSLPESSDSIGFRRPIYKDGSPVYFPRPLVDSGFFISGCLRRICL